jgi:A/G-specific adenine glycosylase
MLQQTQVDRVVPFYTRFLARFPDVFALSRASLGDVLMLWQGLGYNRRAKMLHQCAKVIVSEYHGVFPKTAQELRSLPGVGPYTAGALMAFAYNTPTTMIETNIRTVFIHHFFLDRTDVHDQELLPLIERMMDADNPRTWYAALMDYGTHLKRTQGNASRKSLHHTVQKKFQGSDRQIRGAIIRILLKQKTANVRTLAVLVGTGTKSLKLILTRLTGEGLLEVQGPWYAIRGSGTTSSEE